MLIEQTLTQLHELKLTGMADALEEQRGVPDVQTLPFEDRFALLLERESSVRENRRRTRLLRQAKLRLPSATIEDLNFRAKRGLDRSRAQSMLRRPVRVGQEVHEDTQLVRAVDDCRRLSNRYGQRATLVASQLPIDHWHDIVGDATFGDAILDRLVHHAHRIQLKGASMRRHAPESTT